MIQWVGNSEFWHPIRRASGSGFAMPLVEEAVLDVGAMPKHRGLSLRAAINCTSRLAQRVVLESTGLNPEWTPFPWMPGVIKASASCASSGVRFLPENDRMRDLARYAPGLAQVGVVEQLIGGPAYEIDGYALDGRIRFFCPLLQHWNEDHSRILGYERREPTGIREAAAKAVEAVGIDDCPFCVELRLDSQWFVMEVNARLGEDLGLAELIWDTCALREIEQAAEA